MSKLKKTGWYSSTSQFNHMTREWYTHMSFIGENKESKPPEGAWWHTEGEEVDAVVTYPSRFEFINPPPRTSSKGD